MKRADDPRHLKRITIMQTLFGESFTSQPRSDEANTINQITSRKKDIDLLIENAAPQFPVDKISKIDVAILRLSIYELVFIKTEPPKVIIDEAVELAKEFGNDNSASFVNGVLGNIIKQ